MSSKSILQRSTNTSKERESGDSWRLTEQSLQERIIEMLHRVMITSAWAYLAFIVFATLSPIAARPVIAGGVFPGVERFAAYAALGFLVYLAYPRHLTFACIVVAGSAITLELLQALRPDRHPRVLDAIEKLLGGVAGIVLAGILLSLVWPSRIAPVDRLPRG